MIDVNPQMSKAALPEHNNAQLPHWPRLALILPSVKPEAASFPNLHPQGVEKCVCVTPYARVSVHDGFVDPELALSCRTLASL
jgi:hypothetical protein